MDRNLFIAGLVLILVGIAIAAVGPLITIALSGMEAPHATKVHVAGGGCVVIAFIPICFGYGVSWLWIVILAVVCATITVVLYIIARMLVRGVGFEPTQAYASGSPTRAGRS